MFCRAITKAQGKLWSVPVSQNLLDLLTSADKNLLLMSAKLISQYYYQSKLSTICAINPRYDVKMPSEESGFATKTVAQLVQDFDSFAAMALNQSLGKDAFTILKKLIIDYELLPIEPGNPTLGIKKLRRDLTSIERHIVYFILLMALSSFIYIYNILYI